MTKNSNIRKLSLSSGYLLGSKQEFFKCETKLEKLKIHETFQRTTSLRDTFDLLNQLYERGFYKELHFDSRNDMEYDFEQLTSLYALSVVSIMDYSRDCGLSRLINLKEVNLLNDFTEDFELIAKSLVNLQRIHLDGIVFDDILQFVRHSAKLKEIKVRFCESHGDLDLEKLNEERKKFANACKVRIFVTTDLFLKTKWTTKNGDLNLSFIELSK